MLYSALSPLRLYNNMHLIPLPRNEKVGFGEAIFLTTLAQTDSIQMLNNEALSYKADYYKYYYIDNIYKEHIGFKKITLNKNASNNKTFKECAHPLNIKYISYSSRASFFKKGANTIIDLSIWLELYFKYRLKSSSKCICTDYINFIAKKVNDTLLEQYNKTFIIDVSYWFKNKTFSYDRKSLNDPLTLLMFALYKMPETMSMLSNIDFFIIDSTEGKALKIPGTELTKKNYNTIKSKLSGFDKLKNVDTVKEDGNNIADKKAIASDPVLKISVDKEKVIQQTRTNIVNSVKKNFVGEIEDATSEIENEDDTDIDDEIIKTEDVRDQDIEAEANQYLDENPELVSVVDPTTAVKEVMDHVKRKVYISKFMPDRSEDTIKRINELQKQQEKVIGLPSFESLESKMIDETDYSEVVRTNNPNIIKSKFANFDHSYNQKKLNSDIDDILGSLQSATNKIFVTNKIEEDASDQLNLKKTITYFLEDEAGKKMKLKFDVPLIIDDKYLYLNGAKKIIQHQLILKPLSKTSPDTVWIVSAYNKIQIFRKGDMDLTASTLLKMLNKNPTVYKVKEGNSGTKNKAYNTTLDFDIIAKSIYSFDIGSYKFVTDIDVLIAYFEKNNIKVELKNGAIPIGYEKSTKKPILMEPSEDYINKIAKLFDDDQKKEFKNYANSKKLMYAECTVLGEHVPLLLFMLFCEGFKSVMTKSNIEYTFVQDKKDTKDYDPLEYGTTELSDGYIVWKRYPMQNSLLMNGLQNLPMELYSYEELESKETYSNMFTQFHDSALQSFNLDQFKDFMIDPITKEILIDFHLPSDLVTLMAYAVILLVDNKYLPENNFNNLRVRSNELIPYWIYNEVTKAYGSYRKSWDKKNRTSISIKQDCIVKDLMMSKLIEDSSTLNPVLELEKNRAVTYKGERGINLDQAMTLPRRGYDESMLGVVGITTSPDANVGVVHQLTLEPTITSTRGYINTHDIKSVEELNSANLLTPAELLTPLGVQHDDPTRTSIELMPSK